MIYWITEIWAQFIVAISGITLGAISIAFYMLLSQISKWQQRKREALQEERRLTTIELIKARDVGTRPIQVTNNEIPQEVLTSGMSYARLDALNRQERRELEEFQRSQQSKEEIRQRMQYLLDPNPQWLNKDSTSKREVDKPIINQKVDDIDEDEKPMRELKRRFKLDE